MSAAREAVLGRIRAALGAPAVPEVERGYRHAGETAGRPEDVERFAERVADYQAHVTRTGEDGLLAAISERLAHHGAARIVVSPGIGLTPAGVAIELDAPELDPRALDGFDGVLTGCALAVAETGTIVLDGGTVSGRRAITLVPDLHVCVVRAAQVVAGVAEAVARLAEAARDGRPITWVSGPSATSDIELERVDGVHGPRRLEVVLVG
jgi:L-lactate dehydrogenase complex protein LldG